MWRTSIGKRTLQGAEADLFREAAGMFFEWMVHDMDFENGDSYHCGFKAFDSLSKGQQVAIFKEVCEGMLDHKCPAPMLYASNEALIAAIYHEIRVIQEEETQLCIDSDDQLVRPISELIIAAAEQHDIIKNNELEPPYDKELDLLIECLENTILWDNDFLDFSTLDASPEMASYQKDTMNIADDYYTYAPNDPSEAETEKMITEIRMFLNNTMSTEQD